MADNADTKQAVYTTAQTRAMVADTKRNPVSSEQDAEVHLTLRFTEGYDPVELFDALRLYGADITASESTVNIDKKAAVQADMVPSGGRYSFIIS